MVAPLGPRALQRAGILIGQWSPLLTLESVDVCYSKLIFSCTPEAFGFCTGRRSSTSSLVMLLVPCSHLLIVRHKVLPLERTCHIPFNRHEERVEYFRIQADCCPWNRGLLVNKGGFLTELESLPRRRARTSHRWHTTEAGNRPPLQMGDVPLCRPTAHGSSTTPVSRTSSNGSSHPWTSQAWTMAPGPSRTTATRREGDALRTTFGSAPNHEVLPPPVKTRNDDGISFLDLVRTRKMTSAKRTERATATTAAFRAYSS